MSKVGILSPGKMGKTIGLSLMAAGHEIFFFSKNRSMETINSANSCGFTELEKIHNIATACDAVICIGTRDIAFEVPRILFMETNFSGLYIDLNSLNGEIEEKKWRSLMDNLTDTYVEGAVRGYPINNISEATSNSHMMIVSGKHANSAHGLFINTIWSVQYSETYAKVVNRYMAMADKIAENEPLYQDKSTPKELAWEQSSLDLIANKFYVNGRTGAETMVEIWQQIKDGKLRNICAELGFPEHLGFIHAINRFGKNITANKSLDKQRSSIKNVWQDPEFIEHEQNNS